VLGLRSVRAVSLLLVLLVLGGTLLVVGRPGSLFWAFWALVILVLFQPEIRRALGRASRRLHGLLASARQEAGHVVDDVVEAAHALASQRIGALIVLERATALGHYVELGVPLDALVSSDLLESLFHPYSPLHDGAVFIQGNRIVAAGGFLPLSRNPELSRKLGTRHRAALGLSEETDAVVVVVSEETGRVSLAVDGRMETPLDRGVLRQRLTDLWAVGAPPPRGSLWGPLARRWGAARKT
jgi:diadenylate cyclase